MQKSAQLTQAPWLAEVTLQGGSCCIPFNLGTSVPLQTSKLYLESRGSSANSKQELALGAALSHSSAAPWSSSGKLRHTALIMTSSDARSEVHTHTEGGAWDARVQVAFAKCLT